VKQDSKRKDVPGGGSRALRVAIVIAALAAIGGAVWLTTFRRDTTRELRAATTAFLTRVTDGHASDAYAQGADELHANVDHGVFQLAADDLTEVAGKLRRVGTLTAETVTGDAKGDGAARASVIAQAELERQTLDVRLGFVRRDEGWRVTSFVVVYPDKMWPAPDPAQLVKESTQWMQWFEGGDLASMYARLYPDVWPTWKPSQFEADINKLRASCQDMQVAAPTVVGTNHEGESLVEARYTCRNGDLVATRLAWTWLRGKWRLLKVSWGVPGVAPAPAAPPPAP
jgi:hypothetical protein